MDQTTNNLIARWYLSQRNYGSVEPREFADWAVMQIEAGKETPHLQMLASEFQANSITEVEPDFRRALDELGWEFPDKSEAIRRYAESILGKIVSEEIKPFEGCSQLYMMCSYADYPEYLQNWNGLYWAEEDMPIGELDQLIIDEAKGQLKGERRPLIPEAFTFVQTSPKLGIWERFLEIFR
ncbi:MAG: hypothetical protein ABL959_06490 [Pyrinomonadaceae bacterium]